MTETRDLKPRIEAADGLIKNLRAEGQTSRADYVAELQQIARALLSGREKPHRFDLEPDQVKALAEFAGFHVTLTHPDDTPMPVTISEPPPGGVIGDDGKIEHPQWVVYSTDYPEEGVMPL